MIIKSVRLKNIRSYLDAGVELPEGSTLLAGDIGSGKSTILLAVDFALFGLRKGEVEGSDMLRHGAAAGSVELAFSLNGNDLCVRRTLRRTRNGISQASGTLRINGVENEYMPSELKAKILEMLGYPLDAVSRNRPIFRYTVYAPQEEMKRIMSDANARIETLRKIFGIDKYGTIRSNAKAFGTELRAMGREAKARASGAEEKEKERAEAQRLAEKLGKEAAEAAKRLEAVEKIAAEKQSALEAVRAEARKHAQLREKHASLASSIESKRARAARLEKEIAAQKSRGDAYSKELASLPAAPGDEKIRAARERRDALSGEIALLRDAAANLSLVMKEGRCSFCGQAIADKASFQKHLAEKQQRLGEALGEAEAADAELSQLRDALAAAEKASHIRSSLEEISSAAAAMSDELEALGEELSSAEKEAEALSDGIAAGSGIESESKALSEEIARLTEQRISFEKKRASASAQRDALLRAAEAAGRDIEAKKKAAEAAKRLEAVDAWLPLFAGLMETIEKHVMLSLQKEFNVLFQQWFSLLMADALDVRVDESFSPVISQNGFETRYENLSGGEKTSVALAYRLALNSVINRMIDAINTKDIIILDEPTDGFSTDQLDRLRDVIRELGLKQIIIVSHEPKIDTYVDSVLRVYKDNHVSRIGA